MSRTPLLCRREELEAARRINQTRKELRRAILSGDYMLQAAAGMLEKAARGKIRVDVVCEAPLSDRRRKQRLLALIGPNLHTMRDLLRRNRDDFAAIVSKRRSRADRREIRRRSMLRRAKAVRLAEETPIRLQHLQVVLRRLREIRRHIDNTVRELAFLRQMESESGAVSPRIATVRKELYRLVRIAGDTPDGLGRRLDRIAVLQRASDLARRRSAAWPKPARISFALS